MSLFYVCPDMTEKLLTGTLSLNTNKQNLYFTRTAFGLQLSLINQNGNNTV